MRVWQVIVSDCESSSTVCICSTKEIALREMFAYRDKLIKEWTEHMKHSGIDYAHDIYKQMIIALSHNDYENWNNYPHEVPSIEETEVIDK